MAHQHHRCPPSSAEPFWNMYKQHNKEEVRAILAKYKIGKLEGGAAASVGKALEDPFKAEPQRHAALVQVRGGRPVQGGTL